MPKKQPDEYKTSPAVRRAVRKYEDKIYNPENPDDENVQKARQKRNVQKIFSSAKSFIRLHANLEHLEELKQLIQEKEIELESQKNQRPKGD